MKVELLPAGDRDEAARHWQALEQRVPDRPISCSWTWVETWLEHYGDAVPHRFALGHGPDGPLGLTLGTEDTRARGPVRLRRLHLGTVAEPEGEGVYACYNALLAAPEDAAAFASALAGRLGRERGWDELRLDRFHPAAAEAVLRAFGRVETSTEQAPTVDLRAAGAKGGEVLATLRSRTRQQIRRSLRELGEVTTEVAATPAEATAILDELIELHQRRWEGEGAAGAFASARLTAFHRALIARLLASGGVMLFRARAESGTVGCIYNVNDGDHVLSYLQGFAPFADKKVKPGFVSHALCMQACFERGLAEYDLLPEPTGYKLELSNGMRELVSGRLSRRRPKPLLLDAARRARSRVRAYAGGSVRRGSSN